MSTVRIDGRITRVGNPPAASVARTVRSLCSRRPANAARAESCRASQREARGTVDAIGPVSSATGAPVAPRSALRSPARRARGRPAIDQIRAGTSGRKASQRSQEGQVVGRRERFLGLVTHQRREARGPLGAHR